MDNSTGLDTSGYTFWTTPVPHLISISTEQQPPAPSQHVQPSHQHHVTFASQLTTAYSAHEWESPPSQHCSIAALDRQDVPLLQGAPSTQQGSPLTPSDSSFSVPPSWRNHGSPHSHLSNHALANSKNTGHSATTLGASKECGDGVFPLYVSNGKFSDGSHEQYRVGNGSNQVGSGSGISSGALQIGRGDGDVAAQPSLSSNDHVGNSTGHPKLNMHDYDTAHMRQVIASSICGNTLEWYDFLIFSTFGSIISKLFFPSSSTYARLLAFYGVFAAGFATRPLGALVFGSIGDRWGRKTALMLSIYAMAIPTALVGCLPTYSQVGMAAPVLLALMRVVQGFAVGGEFTATMVFLVEHSPPHSRGLHGSWAFFSVMVGVILGSLVATIFNAALSEEQLLAWGWRIPFLMSLLGAGVGIYIRRALQEPPKETHATAEKYPWRKVLSGIATVITIDFLNAIGFYLVVIFLPTYFQEFGHLRKGTALGINTANMVIYMAVIPLGGWLSDKYGRRMTVLGPCVLMFALAWPLWELFKQHNAGACWFAQLCLTLMMAVYTGCLPATFVALFPQEQRCTGLSVGHNLSMAIFGGTAPLMATGLLKATGNMASPAILLVISAFLSAGGSLLLRRFGVS